MIVDIEFLSAAAMRRVKPRLDTVVVSVLDRSEVLQHGRPRLAGFRSVLVLEFEDTEEPRKDLEWPDEPTDEQHAAWCQGPGERLPTLSDARRIVDFVNGHHRSGGPLHLIAHCFGGISRSAAIAEWAGARCWVPILGARSTDQANHRLLRLLHKAHAEADFA